MLAFLGQPRWVKGCSRHDDGVRVDWWRLTIAHRLHRFACRLESSCILILKVAMLVHGNMCMMRCPRGGRASLIGPSAGRTRAARSREFISWFLTPTPTPPVLPASRPGLPDANLGSAFLLCRNIPDVMSAHLLHRFFWHPYLRIGFFSGVDVPDLLV